MAGGRTLLLVLIIRVTHVLMYSMSDDEISVQCPTNGRVNLTGEIVDEASGLIVQSGYVFPPDSVWTSGNETFGCVCYNRPICRPVYCPSGTDMYLKIDQDCKKAFYYWFDMEPDFVIYSRKVLNHSIVVTADMMKIESIYGSCEWMETDLQSVKFPNTRLLIRDNGSIYIPRKNISTIFNFDRFCLCDSIDFRISKPTCSNEGEMNGVGCIKQTLNLYLNLLIAIGIKWSMEFSLSLY